LGHWRSISAPTLKLETSCSGISLMTSLEKSEVWLLIHPSPLTRIHKMHVRKKNALIECSVKQAAAKTPHPIDSHVSTAYAIASTSVFHERSDLCRDEILMVCQ
jgi:hypothetical protein